MSFDAQTWALAQKVGDPGAKLLLIVLASYANADGSCYPGQDTLAEKVECSERSIRAYLSKLEKLGLIRRHERRRKGGYKTSDLIVLSMPEPEEVLELGQVEILPAKSAGEKSHRQTATISPAKSSDLTGKSCRYIEDEPVREPVKGTNQIPPLKFGEGFPSGGTIAYTQWAGVAQTNAPGVDVDFIAGRFRAWCEHRGIDLTDRAIGKCFATFCRKGKDFA